MADVMVKMREVQQGQAGGVGPQTKFLLAVRRIWEKSSEIKRFGEDRVVS